MNNMGTTNILKVNWLNFTMLVVYPLVIIALAIWYGCYYGISKREVIFLISTYYLVNIGVGVGLHRLWAHSAFKTTRAIEFFLMILTAAAIQGPALSWAADHRMHHAFTDRDQDPHSPTKYNHRFLGFLWSHVGWMLFNKPELNKGGLTATLRKNQLLVWQFRHYWELLVLTNLLIPIIIGFLVMPNLQGALSGFIFMGLARALQQQMTFCVNSLLHFIGTHKYARGTAGDVWWLSILLLGENWHNFHHAFPSDYRNGHKLYHFDVHKWIIGLLAKLGLAWDVISTSKERIQTRLDQKNPKHTAPLT